ncbi:MAG: DNA repair exonuclease [Deltaproteobacteria bacterium]|nr:DNA repair exonuclease [Deltaproteobacteria bacterium]
MRFLHTSDWQLGLKARFVPGDRGARLRLERFRVVERIAALARETECQAVVVAGDVFDDNAVGPDTLQQTRDALSEFSPIPVLLLPGNHDAATAGNALERLKSEAHGLEHVHLLMTRDPLEVGGATFYPAPLERRHTLDDPCALLPARQEGEGIRVALAHGGVRDFSESTETPNRIDLAEVASKGFDYLALGDWHGAIRLGPRAWYSGTPEGTRFQEKDPGKVLIVEIKEAGAEPKVEQRSVAKAVWLRSRREVSSQEDLNALESWLSTLPDKSWTLLEVRLEGSLSLAGRSRLEALLASAQESFLYLRVDDEALATRPDDLDLELLDRAGFVGRAAGRLSQEGGREAQDALLLLHRLLAEVGSE